jgi:aryl-alcohol dehydrogenase-like predicted oxidoreductase
LAIAWVNKNPRVSTVILGASKLSQLQDNLGALALTPKLTPEVLARIDTISKPLAV